jgi:hypothetical protein
MTEIRSQQHHLKILKASSEHGNGTSLEEGSTDERKGRAEEGDDDTRVERESRADGRPNGHFMTRFAAPLTQQRRPLPPLRPPATRMSC